MPAKQCTINILLLGETGVGKSTWINAFANYCKFATLMEAKGEGGIFPIPSVFHITDPVTRKRQTISTHPDMDLSDRTPGGQSITQDPEEHIFCIGNLSINLIDTPGLLHTDDVSRHTTEKNTVDNTFAVLSMYDEIRAIFVFLKATEARINQPFVDCLTEIFRRLHRSACDNVVFIFTYAAGACYSSDIAEPVLEKFIQNYGVPIQLPPPIFCFENGTVKNLAEHKNGIVDRQSEPRNEESWKFSTDALEACMKHTLSLERHQIASTVSIHWAICIISKLFGLLTDTIKCINDDISSAYEQQKRVEDLKQQVRQSEHPESLVTCLRDKCYIKDTRLNIEKSGFINVVCESMRCITMPVADDKQVFTQICFEGITESVHAYISNSAWFDDPATSTQLCKRCGCARACHRIRWFRVQYVTEHIPLTDFVVEFRSPDDALEYLNNIIPAFKERGDELQQEEEAILETCAELMVFMHQNALIKGEVQTNTDHDKLLHTLQKEIEKYSFVVDSGCATQLTKRRLDNLQKMREKFQMLLNADGKDGREIRYTDVEKLIEKLYELPKKGPQLKTAVDDVEEAWRQLRKDAEDHRQHIDLNDSVLLSRVINQPFNSIECSE